MPDEKPNTVPSQPATQPAQPATPTINIPVTPSTRPAPVRDPEWAIKSVPTGDMNKKQGGG